MQRRSGAHHAAVPVDGAQDDQAAGIETTGRAAYLRINVAGSAGLAVSMAVAHAWQSAALNALWLAFGIAPLVRASRPSSRRRSEAEPALADAAECTILPYPTESAQVAVPAEVGAPIA